jgi:fatty aldehyde-generating acyl-ACP reductase
VDTFAFIIHPINIKRDVIRKYPFWGRVFTERQISFLSTFFPPIYISEITGVKSISSGKEIKGWFLACPLTPDRMLELPEKKVYRKIIQTGNFAQELGAKMLGLGAFTSVVGDSGITIANSLDIPVTTGDAYTVHIAVEAVYQAAQAMEIPIKSSAAAVVGATGAIGQVCAQILANDVAELYLIGRRKSAVDKLKSDLLDQGAKALIHTSIEMDVLQNVQLILTVTSAIGAVIHPEHLQPGSVVCDVARPRDVAARVASARNDVLVIDGGMVEMPGNVNFNFDFGFPSGKAYACMAETMALTLEGIFEDYTVGKDITLHRVKEISEIAKRHGFKISGFRSFEREVTPQQIKKVRQLARNHF